MARLWRLSGRAEYAEDAKKRLTALMDVWQIQREPGRPWKRMCFFSVYPIIDAYRVLDEGAQLDGEFKSRFREFVREAYFPQETGAFNQAFARAAGLAMAAKTFPELAEAAIWKKAAEGVWEEWRRQHDTTENAACYNGISSMFLFLLGDALGRVEEFHEPAAQEMFRRFRDQAAPSGAMPEYGDSGDGEWAMFHCWGNWVAAMERAARLYRDPTFRWVAVRMFQAARKHAEEKQRAKLEAGVVTGKLETRPTVTGKLETRPTAVDGMNSALALCLAEEWRDRELQPRPPECGTAVAYRREPGNDRALDKLLLAPSRRPGVPFAAVELFARSYHAHEDQLGAVLYYEADDIPLLHGLGYHNRAAEQANLVLMCAPGEPFPHKESTLTPGIWNEASLSAKRLPPLANDAARRLRRFDKLTFRVAEDGPVELFLASLRLSGPKGDLPLDDFQEKRGWRGGRQELVPGEGQSGHAMKVACRRGTNFVWRDGFDRTFSLDDYDRIKFSWKMLGTGQGWSKSLILRVDASPSDFHVVLRGQTAEIVAARAEGREGDQFAQFEAAGWWTSDSRLVRQMLLMREGPLVVCDRVVPGRQADGWLCGPLWHLHGEPVQGPNWFDSPGRRNLMVWMSRAPGRMFGMKSTVLWSGVRPHTVFAQETLRADRPIQFVTVLVPHQPEIAAADLAAGIGVEATADGSAKVRFRRAGSAVFVEIDGNGAWTVKREK
jgi:hypothetical protein